MLSILLLLTAPAWANDVPEFTFTRSASITSTSYSLDGKSSPLECHAYGNPSGKGLKVRLKSAQGLVYGLECESTDIGSALAILVMENGKTMATMGGAVSSGGDCGYTDETRAWLVDLNKDKFVDLVLRFRSKTVASECNNRPPSEEERLTVFHWRPAEKVFAKEDLTPELSEKMKKKFDFAMKPVGKAK